MISQLLALGAAPGSGAVQPLPDCWIGCFAPATLPEHWVLLFGFIIGLGMAWWVLDLNRKDNQP